MPKREPHLVLGVDADASQATIKAAYRKLAREHHPDVFLGDAVAIRRANRQMAEINEAYDVLRRVPPGGRSGSGPTNAGESTAAAGGSSANGAGRPSGPPRPRRTRPVTGRLDTTPTFRPRNATTSVGGQRVASRVQPPSRTRHPDEPLRASDPNGPLERARARRRRPPAPPPLDESRARMIEFGKFHGHTLGEIAAFEPSYIDWLAATITRDFDLVAAARAIKLDLDARGVVRRTRPARVPGGGRR